MLSKLRKPIPDRDQVVIIEDNGLADIATVFESDDQAIYAQSRNQEYAIPQGDVKAYVGSQGRIFVLTADTQYVRDTERLAALERSIVLRQITQYKQPIDEQGKGLRIRDFLLYAALFILLLVVIVK